MRELYSISVKFKFGVIGVGRTGASRDAERMGNAIIVTNSVSCLPDLVEGICKTTALNHAHSSQHPMYLGHARRELRCPGHYLRIAASLSRKQLAGGLRAFGVRRYVVL